MPATRQETVKTGVWFDNQLQHLADSGLSMTVQSWKGTKTAWLCCRRSWAAPPPLEATCIQTLETTRTQPAGLQQLRKSRRTTPSCRLSYWTTASTLTCVPPQVGKFSVEIIENVTPPPPPPPPSSSSSSLLYSYCTSLVILLDRLSTSVTTV